MKKIRFQYPLIIMLAALIGFQSCNEHYITYDDAEYIMFSDTSSLFMVREDMLSYDVPVVSTVVKNYDRHFAVEILDPSSTAVEGRDYTLDSNNLTIKAGQRVGYIRVNAAFDRLDTEKQLEISMRLVVPDNLISPLYGDCTKLKMQKTNKFNREKFTGWAVVSSMFLYEYSLSRSYQKLIYTEPDPENENGVILRSFLADGYDVKIVFDDDTDPAAPRVITLPGQIVSDEGTIFGMVHGDNHILIETSPAGSSYFLGHAAIAVLVQRFYVENIGDLVGIVGDFLTEIDWVSDEEADRLKREEGM